MKKRFVASFLGMIILVLALSGCGCNHQWEPATCLAPRTCRLCGATEGKTRSHEWESTACNAPLPCKFCGTMEGMELTHQWQADCRICIHCGKDERPADVRFPEALIDGLEARWALEHTLTEDAEYDLTKDDWTALFDAEYKGLCDFHEADFSDETLKEAALSYIASIEASIAALEHFGTDLWIDQYHSSAYQNQTVALYQLSSLFPVEVAEEYQADLKSMLANGEIITTVIPLIDQIFFLHVNTDGDEKKYETTLENSTSLTFEWIKLDIHLLDENGEIVAQENSEVAWWSSGEKRRFNFTTSEEFASMKVTAVTWMLGE